MKKSDKKIRTLSCCLIELQENEMIRNEEKPEMKFIQANELQPISIRENIKINFRGYLFTESSNPKSPQWLNILEEGFDIPKNLSIQIQSSSALLVIYNDSFPKYALCFSFGYGYKWIDNKRITYDFGRRIVLNRVNPDKITTMDVRSVEDQVKYIKSHVNNESNYKALFSDLSSLIVHSLSGKPEDSSFALKIAGTDYLSIRLKFSFEDFSDLFKKLITAWQSEEFKDRFPDFEHLKQVKDLRLITQLEEKLVQEVNILKDSLKQNSNQDQELSSSNFFLAAPEYNSEDQLEYAFQIKGVKKAKGEDATRYQDIDFKLYLSQINKPISISQMRGDRVGVIYPNSESVTWKWSVYDCVVFETDLNHEHFILLDRKWYKIDSDYYKNLDLEIETIHEKKHVFPDAKKNEDEEKYNNRASSIIKDCLCLDKNLFYYEKNRIEVCDLLFMDSDSKYVFAHIKRKTKSATLSHLFAQGRVSVECLLDKQINDEYLKFINDAIVKNLSIAKIQKTDIRTNIKITYGIITSKTHSNMLPFFSKVNLRNTKNEFDRLGIACSLVLIKEN